MFVLKYWAKHKSSSPCKIHSFKGRCRFRIKPESSIHPASLFNEASKFSFNFLNDDLSFISHICYPADRRKKTESTLQNKSQPNLLDLPDSLLLEIFRYISPGKYLEFLRKSCTRIAELINDNAIMRIVKFKLEPQENIRHPIISEILNRSKHSLKEIDFSNCPSINDHILCEISQQCQQISHINISNCQQVTNYGIKALSEELESVENFKVSKCRLITCQGILWLVQKHQNVLHTLNFSKCLGLRLDAFKLCYIISQCQSLTHLSMGWERKHAKINPLIDTDIIRLAQHCPKLQYLDICYSHATFTSIEAIAQACPQLRYLNIAQSFIHNTVLDNITRLLINVSYLNLSDCWTITPDGLPYLYTMINLYHLNLSRCYEINSTSIYDLTLKMTSLRELILVDCLKVDNAAISHIPEKCPKLILLDVSGTMVTQNALDKLAEKTNSHFQIITNCCPLIAQ